MDNNLTKAFSDLTGLFSRLAGPLADELGKMAGDRAREYRVKNAIKIFSRINTMLADAGINPEPIPPRLFLPALEAATIEDNEGLQERWAALLANAADPSKGNPILPAFVEILKELTPEGANFIRNVHHNAPPPHFRFLSDRTSPAERKISPKDRGFRVGNYETLVSLGRVGEPVSLDPPDSIRLSLIVDDLVRLGLLDRLPWYPTASLSERPDDLAGFTFYQPSPQPGDSEYFIPPFGLAFLKACEPPLRTDI